MNDFNKMILNLNIFDVHKHFPTNFASVGVHPLLLVVALLEVDMPVVQDQVAALIEPFQAFLALVVLNLKNDTFKKQNNGVDKPANI